MRITDNLTEDLIDIRLAPGPIKDIVERMVEVLSKTGKIRKPDAVVEALMTRENVSSTGVGSGLALPHARSTETEKLLVSCGICQKGTDFNALDGNPVFIFFAVIAPQDAPGMHLKLLSAITRVMADESIRHRMCHALTPQEVLEILRKAETTSEYA